MKLYLSSYKIGNEAEKLQSFFRKNKSVGYIPNALDFAGADPQKKQKHIDEDLVSLREIGLDPQCIDLQDFFENQEELRPTIDALGGIWVSGGNVFVLRQAMYLSGLDEMLTNDLGQREDFIYGGYSAAGCVLSPSLKCYQIVDDCHETPYPECKNAIWEGLNIISFAFLPHFASDHPESAAIDKEVEYCTKNHIPFKTLRDGEVLVI
ncbi:hypothetical protein A2881_00600 [Candidatus Peribacteria bacterium RIFCSPHIGHO2_01_FULL_55_13]|nr:MAG: hypothetical protein A2881_00600 [Candidatus Peribacteria bacterium RIFCSPHIGHO2_01_FULL_55_13]OGJ64803.1 MAG: hypothetical protein A3F36_03235 [Candidatus Peribacteria bacterium RIFCSPHIGHO2_12_FULL_55_11]